MNRSTILAAAGLLIPGQAMLAVPTAGKESMEVVTVAAVPGTLQRQDDLRASPIIEYPRLPDDKELKEAGIGVPEALLSVTLSATAGVEYHDNVLSTATNEQEDVRAFVIPRLDFVADLNALRLDGHLQLDAGVYDNITDNNYIDLDLRTRARWRGDSGVLVTGSGRFRLEHSPIGGLIDDTGLNAAHTTKYAVAQGTLQVQDSWNRVAVTATTDVTGYKFQDNNRQNGAPIINGDRDRVMLDQSIALSLAIDKLFKPTVFLSANTRQYSQDLEGFAFDRDSKGYRALAGMTFDSPGGTVTARAAAGVTGQDYDSDALGDITTFAADAGFTWAPNTAFSIQGDYSRTIEETTLQGGSGYISDSVGVEAKYSLNPDWSLQLSGGFRNRDFKVNSALTTRAPRTDRIYEIEASTSYHITGPFHVDAGFRHTVRDSTEVSANYDANVAFLTFRAKL